MKKSILFLLLPAALVSCKDDKADYDATGVFEATEVIISSEANGRILSFNAEEGDRVSLGDTIVQIDNTQLQIQRKQLDSQQEQIVSQEDVTRDQQQATLSQKEATLAQSPDITAQLAVINQQIANLQNEKGRTERLLEAGAAPQKQLDDINYQIAVLNKQAQALNSSLQNQSESIKKQAESVGQQAKSADSQIASIKKQANTLNPQKELVDDKISRCIVSSPINGTVLAKYKEAGELAAMGTPLFKVADISNMILRAYIVADQYNKLKIGQKVKVAVDGNDKMYEGTVTWISSKAEFTPKTIQTKDERQNLVYAIKISVKNDGLIKIGMYGDVIL